MRGGHRAHGGCPQFPPLGKTLTIHVRAITPASISMWHSFLFQIKENSIIL